MAQKFISGAMVMIPVPLRVLVLADSRSFHTERYVRELRKQGCRVLLASLERGNTIHFQLRRIGPLAPLHYALASFQLRRLIGRFNPDIVNAHFATGYGWLAAKALGDRTTAMVLHLWGSDILQVTKKSELHRRKACRALGRADFVIGDSQYLLEQASNLHEIKKSSVQYWGIERQYLALAAPQRPFHRPLRIIVPRQHEAVYDNRVVLLALGQMLAGREITLTVPAFGSLTSEFRERAGACPPDSVRFYKRLPRDQFMEMLSQHDVYLSASRSDSSPASLIEAMALGLVPVAADIPGVREWMTPNSGFLFVPGDTEGLRSQIESIAKAGERLTSMRIGNFERCKRDAIFENTVAETISIMLSLREGHR